MKVLITGGAGYIGTKLTKVLAGLPEVELILIYDNLSRANHNLFLGSRFLNHHKIKFIYGDLLDSRKLRQIFSSHQIDAVYHLAAHVTTPYANTDAHVHEQVNHWGTSEIVQAVEESPGVKKFIYTSSVSVYGYTDELVAEGHPANPQTLYGISKHRGEAHVRRLLKKMDAYILRCANVYGYSKSMRFDAVINRFMFDANFNNRLSIHGNGKQWRAFIHVDMLTQLLGAMILKDIPPGIYNAVDKNLQALDIVDALKQLFPDLEFIFINQHLELRGIRVSPESQLRNYVDFSGNKDLLAELTEFKERFAF